MSFISERTLGELGIYINGRGFKPADWGKSGFPIVRIANLNNPSAPYDYYSGALDKGHRIDTGDIIVSWSATLDAYLWDRGPAALNQHSFKVVPNESIVDRDYLFYVLKSAMVGLSDLVHGATMKHVTRPEFEGFRIWIHDNKSEQRQIAARLKAQLAEVETARQAAQMQASEIALLRDRVLHEAFASFANSPRKVLGDHAATTSGTTPSRGNKRYWEPAEIPWVKTGEIAFAPITKTEEAVSRVALAECSLTLLPSKTVLVAMYGQGKTRGQSAILEIEAATNQACFAILPNETWEPEFLYYWLMASYQELRDLSEDRGGNQANLNGALLKALEVPAPSKAEQLDLVARIQAAMTEIDALENASKAALEDINRLPARVLAQAFAQ